MKAKISLLFSLMFSTYAFATGSSHLRAITTANHSYTEIIGTHHPDIQDYLKTLCEICEIPYSDTQQIFCLNILEDSNDLEDLREFLKDIDQARTTHSLFECKERYLNNPAFFQKIFTLIKKYLPQQEKDILNRYLTPLYKQKKMRLIVKLVGLLVFLAGIAIVISCIEKKLPDAFNMVGVVLLTLPPAIALMSCIDPVGKAKKTKRSLEDKIAALESLLHSLENSSVSLKIEMHTNTNYGTI